MLGVTPSPLASWNGFQAIAEASIRWASVQQEIYAAWLSSVSGNAHSQPLQVTLGHPRCATLRKLCNCVSLHAKDRSSESFRCWFGATSWGLLAYRDPKGSL